MKIGIFGGSFNPIHKGHIKIANDAINMLNLDILFFVPAYKNPFKKQNDYVDVKHRINMIKLVLNNPKMQISEFEANRIFNSYTIDTVNHFKEKYQNDELYLLIGSDNIPTLNRWKDIDKISKLAKIVIFKRTEKTVKHPNLKKFNCILLNNSFYDFSSTKYKLGDLTQVEEKVQEYIGKNCLYFTNIAMHVLSHERYMHLLSAAKMALDFAKLLKPNDKEFHKNAYCAGLMHDITKEWSKQQSIEFLKKYGLVNLEPYQFHQNTAFYYLRDVYKYPNLDVLNAIKIHTGLAKELTLLDKILFTADKICNGRNFPGVQKIRKLAFSDFEKGFAETVKICAIDFNLEKKVIFSPEQKFIYEKWAKIN